MSPEAYALAHPYATTEGLWVKAVVRGSTVLDPCSGVVERRTAGGAWVPADTLGCEGAPPPHPVAPDTTVSASLFHLPPSALRRLVAGGRSGAFRVVYQATGPGGRPLPPDERTSPPFRVVTFGSTHPEAIEDVEGRAGWRALAVARREDQTYAWGYSYDARTDSAAANRALQECRERAAGASCWIERILPPPSAE